MTTPASLYESSRLAAGYAYARPPVHRHIIERVRQSLSLTARVARALDVGCGAGLPTAAIAPLARNVIGLEPARTMLTHCPSVAPHAAFVVGMAERLPFPAGTFDLVTAGGSVNYMDHDRFLAELARVLTPGGSAVIYDFSPGRRTDDGPWLDEWFTMFERRYLAPRGDALDVRSLDYPRFGLLLRTYEDVEVGVAITRRGYLEYVLSETRVEEAISGGVAEASIRDWCERTLPDRFDDQPREVRFASYIAYIGSV